MKERTTVNLLRAGVCVGVLGAWQLIVVTGVMSDRILASPTQLLGAIPDVLTHDDFAGAVRITLWQTALAFGIAVVVGSTLGLVIAGSTAARRAVVPYILLGNSFPTILLYPVFLVVLGLGTKSIVAVAVGLPIMVISLNTMEGLLGVPAVFDQVGRSLGASRWTQFAKVRLPAAKTLIFAGWRVALLYSFLAVIATQFLLTGQGLGFFIIRYYNFFQVEELYASIVVVAFITLIIEAALSLLERVLVGGEGGSVPTRTRHSGIS